MLEDRIDRNMKMLTKKGFKKHEQIWLQKQTDLFFSLIQGAPGPSIEDRLSSIDSFTQFILHCMETFSEREIYRVASVLMAFREDYIIANKGIYTLDFIMTQLAWDLLGQVGVELFEFKGILNEAKQIPLSIILKHTFERAIHCGSSKWTTLASFVQIDGLELQTLASVFNNIAQSMDNVVIKYGISWPELSFNPFCHISLCR
jgi:hypothetical protein